MRCGIVGMGTRSVGVNPGKIPTIAHVPMEIVHRVPPAKGDFEKVPIHITAREPPAWVVEGQGGDADVVYWAGMPARCPMSRALISPVSASRRRIAPPPAPVARSEPSGL